MSNVSSSPARRSSVQFLKRIDTKSPELMPIEMAESPVDNEATRWCDIADRANAESVYIGIIRNQQLYTETL